MLESSSSRRARRALGLAFVCLATGCFERNLAPVNPCTRSTVSERIQITSVDAVDLLMMIDRSPTMVEEQGHLATQIPHLVQVLASGDRDGDGMRDFPPVRSLHVGIVSQDMGAAGFDLETCTGGLLGAMYGDDGILLHTASQVSSGCPAGNLPQGGQPGLFEFMPASGADPTAFANLVTCVGFQGTMGCGFELPLEAVLKASSPSVAQSWTEPGYLAPSFFGGTSGHADDPGTNGGFIRDNSALAIIIVTDEDDHSWADPELTNPNSTIYTSNINVRGFAYPEALHPIERYVHGDGAQAGHAGYLGLRANPHLLIFGVIAGIPDSIAIDPTRPIDYDAILNNPLVMPMLDPSSTEMGDLVPSCNRPATGTAYPPVRLVQVAQGISAAGGGAIVQSICQDDFGPALDGIITLITNALSGVCLPHALNPDADGFVACDVFETLPVTGDHTTCDPAMGRSDAGTVVINGETHNRCAVTQVGPGGGTAGTAGWFYEDVALGFPGSDLATTCPTGHQQRIHFTIDPVANSEISLDCRQTLAPSGGAAVGLGYFCSPTDSQDICATQGLAPNRITHLACDPLARTCERACTSDADCTAAGILGEVCDVRTWNQLADGSEDPDRIRSSLMGGGVTDLDAPHGFCVSPTCL